MATERVWVELKAGDYIAQGDQWFDSTAHRWRRTTRWGTHVQLGTAYRRPISKPKPKRKGRTK